MIRHLTSIRQLDRSSILSILERASIFSHQIKNKQNIEQTLKNKIVANLFFENSTRTKFSFEVAAKRLGAHLLNFDPNSSSIKKGESLHDTLKTFQALGVDIGIIRHTDDMYINSLTKDPLFSIINAGAGKYEHPSQTLLDLYTIKEQFKHVDDLTVTICGDIKNSRVAKSNIAVFEMFNCSVNLCGPKELLPEESTLSQCCTIKDFDEALRETDVLILLRVQHERHKLYDVDTTSYNESFGLNHKRIKLLKNSAIFLHPGPFNRGVEITSELVEHKLSRIFKQKENGVYTRMALLEWINNE